MASRQELVVRANAVGLDPTTIPNDSKLEQKVLWLEKRATTFAGTLATQTLTSDATPQSDGDKVTIGDITYTFKTSLSEAKATATLTSDATNPDDGGTMTVDGITYVFRSTLSSPEREYEIKIGASAAATLDNVKAAINNSGGTPGTDYSSITTAHPTVTATTNTNTTQVVEAKRFGTYGNSILTSENATHLSWGGSALSGGVDPVPYQVLLGANAAAMLDNLKDAINNGSVAGSEGTTYSTGTKAHPQVTATTNTNTTQVVEARDYSVTNASIATTDPTDTGNHMSWGSTTLASGVAKVVALNTTTASGSAGLSGDKNVA